MTESERLAYLLQADLAAVNLCRAYKALGIPAFVVREAEDGEVSVAGPLNPMWAYLLRRAAVACDEAPREATN